MSNAGCVAGYGYPDDDDYKDPSDFDASKKIWASDGTNFYSSFPTVEALPPGQYTIQFSHEQGYYFNKSKLNLDDIFIMEDSVTDDVMDAMKTFWSNERKYRDFGFLWKRGVLLYGPPGTGKTCTVQLLAKEVEKLGGISIYISNPGFFQGVKTLRNIEPTKPLVVILEDIDSIIDNYGESDVLSILDGEMQFDNIVFVATTNYINKLPARIKNRPSRFDVIRKIDFPSAKNREAYLIHKNPRLKDVPEELAQWVELTDKFSVAHLKELIISVECLGTDFATSVKRLRALIDSEVENDMESLEEVYECK